MYSHLRSVNFLNQKWHVWSRRSLSVTKEYIYVSMSLLPEMEMCKISTSLILVTKHVKSFEIWDRKELFFDINLNDVISSLTFRITKNQISLKFERPTTDVSDNDSFIMNLSQNGGIDFFISIVFQFYETWSSSWTRVSVYIGRSLINVMFVIHPFLWNVTFLTLLLLMSLNTVSISSRRGDFKLSPEFRPQASNCQLTLL